MKRVAIVIPSWNNWRMLRNCLVSLKKTSYPWYKVVVVDNGSADSTADSTRSEFPDVDLVRLPRNEGFSIGVNTGVKLALERYRVDYALVLNNDTEIINADWLSHMVRVAEEEQSIGIVNCRFLGVDRRLQPMGLRLLPGLYVGSFLGVPLLQRHSEQDGTVHETDSAGGACFLIKRQVIQAIGLLDERFSPAYFEDVDYGARATKAGFKLVHDGAVTMVHLGSSTGRTLQRGYLSLIYRRNLFLYVRMHHPAMLPLVVMANLTGGWARSVLHGIRSHNGRAALSGLVQEFRNTSLAMRAP